MEAGIYQDEYGKTGPGGNLKQNRTGIRGTFFNHES